MKKFKNRPKTLRPLLGKTVASSLLLMPLIGTATAFAGYGINLFPDRNKTFTYETVFQSTYVPGASVIFGFGSPACECAADMQDANAQFIIYSSSSIGLFHPTLTESFGSSTATLDVNIQNAFAKPLPTQHINAGSTLHLAVTDLFDILSSPTLDSPSITVTVPSGSSVDFTAVYNSSSSTLDIDAGGSGLSSATIHISGYVSGSSVSNDIDVLSDNVPPVIIQNPGILTTLNIGDHIELDRLFSDLGDTLTYNVTLDHPGFFSQTENGGRYLNALKSGVTHVTVSATDSHGVTSGPVQLDVTVTADGEIALPNLTLEVGEGPDISFASLFPQYSEMNWASSSPSVMYSSPTSVVAAFGNINDGQLHLLAGSEGTSTVTITAKNTSNTDIHGVFQVRTAPTVMNRGQPLTFKTDIDGLFHIVPKDSATPGNNILATAPRVAADADGHYYPVFSDISILQSDTPYSLYVEQGGVLSLVRNIEFHFITVPRAAAQGKPDIGDLVKYMNANPNVFDGVSPLNKTDLLQLLEGSSVTRTWNGNIPYLILHPQG